MDVSSAVPVGNRMREIRAWRDVPLRIQRRSALAYHPATSRWSRMVSVRYSGVARWRPAPGGVVDAGSQVSSPSDRQPVHGARGQWLRRPRRRRITPSVQASALARWAGFVDQGAELACSIPRGQRHSNW